MNNLQILMNGVFGRKVPAEFAAADYDYEAALRDELAKLMTKDGRHFDRHQFNRNKEDVFELLEQNLEEVLPQSIQSALDMFVETMHFAQGQRPEFRVTRGKQRGKQFVTRATESGNYETFRLDRDRFDLYIQAIGGAGYVDFERYLDGLESMTDIYEVIQDGIVDRLFEMVQECLLASWNAAGRPVRNKVAANAFNPVAMKKLCNTVAPYGSPIIYCTAEFAAEMVNAIVYNNTKPAWVGGKISDQDLTDIRERGYIGKFQGVPVVIMPQSFTDETNTKLVMNPSFAYVLPAGKEKIIKMAFEGAPYFREWDDHEGDNSFTLQGYVKVGVGLFTTPNYWGIYYNSALDSGSGWENYNQSLIPTLDDGTANS
jgi:hypothetical protein